MNHQTVGGDGNDRTGRGIGQSLKERGIPILSDCSDIPVRNVETDDDDYGNEEDKVFLSCFDRPQTAMHHRDALFIDE